MFLKIFLKLFFILTLIITSGCTIHKLETGNNIKLKQNIKEIYAVYDSSYAAFGFKCDPRITRRWHDKGYKWIESPLRYRKILKYPVDKYFFIGKFIIDPDKNIEFIPVTSSKGFEKKESSYKKEELDNLAMYCSMTKGRLRSFITERVQYTYIDITNSKENKVIKITKEDPEYTEKFLAVLGMSVPYYLVINEQYGKELMEQGIIVPDAEEVKANLIWKDWYFKDIIYTEHW